MAIALMITLGAMLPLIVRGRPLSQGTNPEITAIEVNSDKPSYYVYDPGLLAMGGTVYFNGLAGEGAGQTITVTASITGTNPISAFAGAPAFGDTPGPDMSEPWIVTYTVEADASDQNGIAFTVTDSLSFTDTAVITFTKDITAPESNATSPEYEKDAAITVTWAASDILSGVEVTRLWYKYDGENWSSSAAQPQSGITGTFVFTPANSDGTYYFATVATDRAGNVEAEPIGDGDDSAVYDTTAPTSTVTVPTQVCSFKFLVNWSAEDSEPGSGLADSGTYDVQYDYQDRGWENWIVLTTTTSAVFGPTEPIDVISGTYCFRARARDLAGNEGDYSSGDCTRVVFKIFLPLITRNYKSLTNGGFEYDWTGWSRGGELSQSIVTMGAECGNRAALLGNPGYDCSNGVPMGCAWMRQGFTALPNSKLSFFYRIFSQDQLSGEKYDSFDVYVIDSQGNRELILRDGNTTPGYGCDKPAYDSGWKNFEYDLGRYAGQNVTVSFENCSRHDNWYNTWTYVDCVSVSIE